MDGTCRTVKVLEITPDNIVLVPLSESGAPFTDANETVDKRDVILIHYKSGRVEIYTVPEKNSVYNADGSQRKDLKKEGQTFAFNFASLNTLALVNADLSVFYEHLIPSKYVGFGAMGAYNFNRYAILPNAFIAILNNSKKNYDAGVFANFYPGHFKRRSSFFMGVLVKYTAFHFDRVIEEKNGSAVNIRYIPAKGSQLATLVNVGLQVAFGKNLVFKTFAGIGGFRLKGEYKEQFNYLMNQDRDPGTPAVNYNLLPKFYFGINLGFSF